MSDARWSNGRKKLTTNQESVFRVIHAEELAMGATPANAYREAETFMNESALPDWKQFWIDWNAPPGLLEQGIAMMTGMAMLWLFVQNAEKFSSVVEELALPIKLLLEGVSP